MGRHSALFITLAVFLGGCAERVTENPCIWIEVEAFAVDTNNRRDLRHLSDDAHTAEERAVRYADACCGSRSGNPEWRATYGQTRDQCMISHVISV